jgi:UDP-N-acetylmuramyl pentapeptide synthase
MLRIHTFFDIKHLQVAWITNAASSHGGRVRKRPLISAAPVEIFQVSGKKILNHTSKAIIFTRKNNYIPPKLV